MKTIKCKLINNILTPEKPLVDLKFGYACVGGEYLIFESEEEASVYKIEPSQNAKSELMEKIDSLSDEEAEQLKNLFKN